MATIANLLFVGEEVTIDASLATTATTYSANTLQVDLSGLARQTPASHAGTPTNTPSPPYQTAKRIPIPVSQRCFTCKRQ
ncbi:MAG: hypothetical protein R2932_60165 [Caldilineaceae bacterium]